MMVAMKEGGRIYVCVDLSLITRCYVKVHCYLTVVMNFFSLH